MNTPGALTCTWGYRAVTPSASYTNHARILIDLCDLWFKRFSLILNYYSIVKMSHAAAWNKTGCCTVCNFVSGVSRGFTRIFLCRAYCSLILVTPVIRGDFVAVCNFVSGVSRGSTRIFYAVHIVLKSSWYSRYVETYVSVCIFVSGVSRGSTCIFYAVHIVL